jgi:riboflavin synthase
MFTGIIEELGTVEAVEPRSAGARLRIRAQQVLAGASPGVSIAVNGVCLTAVDLRPGSFAADLAPETLNRTNLGALSTGSLVNLERPLSPSSRLSGHIVQGHVDGTGELISLTPLGNENWWLQLRVPSELDPYFVFKGSVCLDGISLTIARLDGDVLSVTIIPHTYDNTNLKTRRPGDQINIECDIIAKYVEKMLSRLGKPSSLTIEKLREQGY